MQYKNILLHTRENIHKIVQKLLIKFIINKDLSIIANNIKKKQALEYF
jgi:hypothetical protein